MGQIDPDVIFWLGVLQLTMVQLLKHIKELRWGAVRRKIGCFSFPHCNGSMWQAPWDPSAMVTSSAFSFKRWCDRYNPDYLNLCSLSSAWVPDAICSTARICVRSENQSLCGLKLVGCSAVCKRICCTLISLNWNLGVLRGVLNSFLTSIITPEHPMFQSLCKREIKFLANEAKPFVCGGFCSILNGPFWVLLVW